MILITLYKQMQGSVSEAENICSYLQEQIGSESVVSDRFPINPNQYLEALHDGVLLCVLMNKLSGKTVIPHDSIKMSKATLFHKIANNDLALKAAQGIGVNTTSITNQMIVEKKQNVILGFMHQIINNFKINKPTQAPKKQQSPPPPPPKKEQPQHHEPPQKHEPPKQQALQDLFHKFSALSINQNHYINPGANNYQQFDNIVGPQVVVLYGSLRKASVHRSMINYLKQIKATPFFANIHFHEPELSVIPLFNQDVEKSGNVPNSIKSLRDIVHKSHGILIAEPQNNGSLSAVIKNALDWLGSKFDQQQPLKDKKIGMVSASFLTQNQIQDVKDIAKVTHANCYHNAYYASLKANPFDKDGAFVSEEEKDNLAYWYQCYCNFVLSGQPHPEEVSFVL